MNPTSFCVCNIIRHSSEQRDAPGKHQVNNLRLGSEAHYGPISNVRAWSLLRLGSIPACSHSSPSLPFNVYICTFLYQCFGKKTRHKHVVSAWNGQNEVLDTGSFSSGKKDVANENYLFL